VDILVNSAGVTKRTPTLGCSEELWISIMDVNLAGTLRACQIFGETMIAQGSGKIINIASLASFAAFYEVAAYGSSKAAVGALTKSLAVEWAPHGVCVNAIAPGIFPTDLNRNLLDSPRGRELLLRTPMHRFGKVDEVAGAAVFLASDESSFVTGHILPVDGGFLASGVNQ
jgi:NAD(P)-dependent dehydrogenase (short-subunit alcohol dehydrogenase family)